MDINLCNSRNSCIKTEVKGFHSAQVSVLHLNTLYFVLMRGHLSYQKHSSVQLSSYIWSGEYTFPSVGSCGLFFSIELSIPAIHRIFTLKQQLSPSIEYNKMKVLELQVGEYFKKIIFTIEVWSEARRKISFANPVFNPRGGVLALKWLPIDPFCQEYESNSPGESISESPGQMPARAGSIGLGFCRTIRWSCLRLSHPLAAL